MTTSAGTASPSTAHQARTTSSPTAQLATRAARPRSNGCSMRTWSRKVDDGRTPITSRNDARPAPRERAVRCRGGAASVVPAGELLAECLECLVGGERAARLLAGLHLVGRAGGVGRGL